MKCTHCQYDAKTKLGLMRHITRHCKMIDQKNNLDERWIFAASQVYNTILGNRNQLVCLYEKMSILDIAKTCGCNHLVIHRAFDKHHIEKRSMSESRMLAQPKTVETCMRRFGATNPLSKGTFVEQQRNKTNLERYGVQNVFQTDVVITKCVAKMREAGYKKRTATFLQRFGTTSQFGRREIREKITKVFAQNNVKGRYVSNLNRLAYLILKKYHIEYEPEFLIKSEKRTFSYDLRINNMLIELNGDHWHANPNRFKAEDIVCVPKQRFLAKDLWERDARKIAVAKNLGFDVITLWESDLKKDFESVLLSAIGWVP